MDQDTESHEIPQDPTSNEVHEIKNDNAELLTHEELVEQTKQFMEGFRERAKSGTLPQTIFFLDKRARPLAYMFSKLYPFYCPTEKQPEIRFINIGRTKNEYGNDTTERPFTGDPSIIRETYGNHIDQQGRILVVDEYTKTGNTLNTAANKITQAFPSAQVEPTKVYSKEYVWDKEMFGVEEYTVDDYMNMAVDKVNTEYGTEYKTAGELQVQAATNNLQVLDAYKTTFKETEGSIPYTKRAASPQSTPVQHRLKALVNRVFGLRQEEKVNSIKQARKALDTVCEEVVASSATQQHT